MEWEQEMRFEQGAKSVLNAAECDPSSGLPRCPSDEAPAETAIDSPPKGVDPPEAIAAALQGLPRISSDNAELYKPPSLMHFKNPAARAPDNSPPALWYAS